MMSIKVENTESVKLSVFSILYILNIGYNKLGGDICATFIG